MYEYEYPEYHYTFEEIYEAINGERNDAIDSFMDDRKEVFKAMNDIDSYNGVLAEDRYYPMDEIDELLGDKKPSEVLKLLESSFDYREDYFKWGIYGLSSTDDPDYVDDLGYDYCKDIILDAIADNIIDCELGDVLSNYGDAEKELQKLEDQYNGDYYTDEEIQNHLANLVADYSLGI